MTENALLEMRGIVKHYGTVRANDGIDLDVAAGEIVGLLGENGSGKSTLMKVLFGMVAPDAGGIVFRGRELAGHTPREALAAGIDMVHQHFMLIEAMTVADNVMLGWSEAGRWLDKTGVRARIRQASRHYGLDLDPDLIIADLSFGQRQRVEILKTILRGAELVVLDEPTSNLSPPEVGGLVTLLRQLRGEGKGIVFISHKLAEVMAVCDRAVVLRDGRVAGRTDIAKTTGSALARMMVERDMAAPLLREPSSAGEPLLQVERLSLHGEHGRLLLDALSFAVNGGEILGLAGVDGNGQIELAETIAGMWFPSAGRVHLGARDVTRASVAARVDAGLAFIPPDRAGTSLVAEMSVAENLALRDASRTPFSKHGFLSPRHLRTHAGDMIARYAIRTAGGDAAVRQLSGGNQQKIVVAREMSRKPKVLVAFQATWGLDPGATRFVLEQVLALRAAGAAVLYIATELEELLAISDRIGVLFGGRLMGILNRAEADVTQIGLMMAGAGADARHNAGFAA